MQAALVAAVFLLCVLAAAGRVFVARVYKEVIRRSKLLYGVFWERRAKIPLLLELAKNRPQLEPQVSRITGLRAAVSNKSLTIKECVGKEDEITRELSLLINQMEDISEFAQNAVFHAAHKDLRTSLEGIDRGVNDYNFAFTAWENCRKGWWQKYLAFGLNQGETKLDSIGY